MAARTDTKYESDSGLIHRILLTPDYAAVAGTPPAGNVSSNIRPKVSKTNGEFGIRPRGVNLSRTVGTAPDTFKKYAFLPVLGALEFVNNTYAPGAVITIGGVDWTIVTRRPEDF